MTFLWFYHIHRWYYISKLIWKKNRVMRDASGSTGLWRKCMYLINVEWVFLGFSYYVCMYIRWKYNRHGCVCMCVWVDLCQCMYGLSVCVCIHIKFFFSSVRVSFELLILNLFRVFFFWFWGGSTGHF